MRWPSEDPEETFPLAPLPPLLLPPPLSPLWLEPCELARLSSAEPLPLPLSRDPDTLPPPPLSVDPLSVVGNLRSPTDVTLFSFLRPPEPMKDRLDLDDEGVIM